MHVLLSELKLGKFQFTQNILNAGTIIFSLFKNKRLAE
jgi:hypothetical protein